MPSDLETQVARMPCPKCENGIKYIVRGDYELSCGACQGTGLRWPTLSFSNRGGNPNYERTTDVTLEKVLDLLMTGRVTKLIGDSIGWFMELPDGNNDLPYQETPLDAACAALLASDPVHKSTSRSRER